MRTDNPLHSPGYFKSQSRRPTGKHISALFTPLPLARAERRPRPRGPTSKSDEQSDNPRIFQQFHNHPRIPHKIFASGLSAKSIAAVDFALQHGWAKSTLVNYGSAVDRFLAFCSSEGVPRNLRLPTDEFVLCAFAASSAGVHAGSTARNNIAALKAWHVAQGANWNGSSRLHYVLAGVERLKPESSKRRPRPPINASMLRILHDGLNFSDPKDIAVFAAACTAFWGQCRLGEILPRSTSLDACSNLPTRHDVSRSTRNDRSTVLHLPRTKTKMDGENVVLVSQSYPLDPRTALRMHLMVNCCRDTAQLFAYASKSKTTIILTKSKFLERCNEVWRAHGFPRTTGHSFRIGGTTELLLAGVSPDVVKAMGRWSSDAFHRYWRSLEDLAPIHAELINTS